MKDARKLVAQSNILGDEICSILENGGNNGESQRGLERHLVDYSLSPNDREKSATPPSYPIMTRHNGRDRLLEGKVMGFIPLRNRRSGANTHIGEGMTEYTLDGQRVGYGLSEYLDQPEES